MFQLYNGYKLDVNGSSASVAAAWNWIPAPTSVVVGLQIPVLQDGFVELPPHLVETPGMTEADPLVIEPSKSHGSCSVSGMLKCNNIDECSSCSAKY